MEGSENRLHQTKFEELSIALFNITISYANVAPLCAILTFNFFQDHKEHHKHLDKLLNEVYKEVQNNLLNISDAKTRDNYLERMKLRMAAISERAEYFRMEIWYEGTLNSVDDLRNNSDWLYTKMKINIFLPDSKWLIFWSCADDPPGLQSSLKQFVSNFNSNQSSAAEAFTSFLDSLIEIENSVKNHVEIEENRTLWDIWKDGRNAFDQTIAILENIKVGGGDKPIISRKGQTLNLNVKKEYLAAFIQVSKQEGKIPWKTEITHTILQIIIKNSFTNIRSTSDKTLREDAVLDPDILKFFNFLKAQKTN